MIKLIQETGNNIYVIRLRDANEIAKVFLTLLYVPNERLKLKIVMVIVDYLTMKEKDPDYKQKIFVAYKKRVPVGMVVCQIDPHYLSYGRKCASFGWLVAPSIDVSKLLMDECERFVRQHKIRKLRGPINYPKSVGGIGLQVKGFECKMMYGVAFGNPNSNLIRDLEMMGYQKESEYTCMEVTEKYWESGKTIDDGIKLGFRDLKGLEDLNDEIFELARNSFQMSFPDNFGKEERFHEMNESFREVPSSHYQLPDGFEIDRNRYHEALVEAWDSCDLENIVSFVLLAFDRISDKLVGIIICIPDLFQSWLGEPITRVNVDTAMVDKRYAGKGIFSALNNIGQLTMGFHGITYFEGTGIWYNNKDAVNSIFPHCKHIRKHFILQKRIKSANS